jgi:methylated-DNA-[protein]-cysteine S-methyltransferase
LEILVLNFVCVLRTQIATYKGIAEAIHCKSSQAVGQALKRNVYNGAEPSVPCHRIVRSDLTVGGFSGSYENSGKKRALLEGEGVLLTEENGVVRVDKVCNFDVQLIEMFAVTSSRMEN